MTASNVLRSVIRSIRGLQGSRGMLYNPYLASGSLPYKLYMIAHLKCDPSMDTQIAILFGSIEQAELHILLAFTDRRL